MRISTGQLHFRSLNSMLDQQAALSKTQLQIASGKKILSPSDDPIGSSKILSLGQNISVTKQHQENISIARARLNLEESILSNAGNLLIRLRELALQGNNATLSSQDRSALAVEVRHRLNEMISLANSQDANGEFIFSGHQGQTRPFSYDSTGNGFTYAGDDGERYVQISQTRKISLGHPGSDVFLDMKNGNGVFQTMDNPANLGSGVMDTGTTTDVSAYDGGVYDINFLYDAPTNTSNNIIFRDTVGTDDDLGYSLSVNGTVVYTTSENGVPAAPVTTLQDLANEINLSSGATGVTAHVGNDNKLYFYNSDFSAAPISLREEMSGASDGDSDEVIGYLGASLSGTSRPSRDYTLQPGPSSYYTVNDSAGNIVDEGEYQEGLQIAFKGVQTSIKGDPYASDKFTISPSTTQDMFTTIQNLADALETGTSDAAGMARLNNAISRFLGDVEGASENLDRVRADVGARLNVLDTQEGMNEDLMLLVKTTMSKIEDLDYASAITELNRGTVALEAAQKSYLQVNNLSLFNYL